MYNSPRGVILVCWPSWSSSLFAGWAVGTLASVASVTSSCRLYFQSGNLFFGLSATTGSVPLCCFRLNSFSFLTKSSRFICLSRSSRRLKFLLPSSFLCSRTRINSVALSPMDSSSLAVSRSRHKNFIECKFVIERSSHREKTNFLYSEMDAPPILSANSQLKIRFRIKILLEHVRITKGGSPYPKMHSVKSTYATREKKCAWQPKADLACSRLSVSMGMGDCRLKKRAPEFFNETRLDKTFFV